MMITGGIIRGREGRRRGGGGSSGGIRREGSIVR